MKTEFENRFEAGDTIPAPTPGMEFSLARLSELVVELDVHRVSMHLRWLNSGAGERSDVQFEAYLDARDAHVLALATFHSRWCTEIADLPRRDRPLPMMLRLSAEICALEMRRGESHAAWIVEGAGDDSDTLFDAYVDARDSFVGALKTLHSAWCASQVVDGAVIDAHLMSTLEDVRRDRGRRA